MKTNLLTNPLQFNFPIHWMCVCVLYPTFSLIVIIYLQIHWNSTYQSNECVCVVSNLLPNNNNLLTNSLNFCVLYPTFSLMVIIYLPIVSNLFPRTLKPSQRESRRLDTQTDGIVKLAYQIDHGNLQSPKYPLFLRMEVWWFNVFLHQGWTSYDRWSIES